MERHVSVVATAPRPPATNTKTRAHLPKPTDASTTPVATTLILQRLPFLGPLHNHLVDRTCVLFLPRTMSASNSKRSRKLQRKKLQQHASLLKRPAKDKASQYYQHVRQETLTFKGTRGRGRGSSDRDFPNNFYDRMNFGFGVLSMLTVNRILYGATGDRVNLTVFIVHIFWFATGPTIDAVFRYNTFQIVNQKHAFEFELLWYIGWIVLVCLSILYSIWFSPTCEGVIPIQETLNLYFPGASLSVCASDFGRDGERVEAEEGSIFAVDYHA